MTTDQTDRETLLEIKDFLDRPDPVQSRGPARSRRAARSRGQLGRRQFEPKSRGGEEDQLCRVHGPARRHQPRRAGAPDGPRTPGWPGKGARLSGDQ